MKEEGISSSCDPFMVPKSSSPPPPATPAASSAGASSPAFPMNIGSTDGPMKGQSSKGGSLSRIGSQPMRTSPSTSAGGSVLGSSQPSCRPWDSGDLLRRLSTFTPANWCHKLKAASSLACARRGWVNVNIDKLECESCGANIEFQSSTTWTTSEADNATEEFSKKLDKGHKGTCPWRGNSCAESLVQFPPAPPAALIGGFKDRCDGLIQFPSLPVVSASAIERMRTSRGAEIDRFLVQLHSMAGTESGLGLDMMLGADTVREDVFFPYSRAQKLISLCGWEPRWLPNVQDCEENSAQSARNGGGSIVRSRYHAPPKDPGRGKKALTAKNKMKSRKEGQGPNCKGESRSPLLDCNLCGATVRIWDFLTVDRPACFTPNCTDVPDTSKKMGLTRGASAASGISGWVAADGTGKNKIEDHDEADGGIDLNLTMGGYQVAHRGKGILIRQPSSSEVGNRAASYESRGPTSRKRNIDEGGSTVDLPQIVMQQADSIEGTVIDRDGDEVNDGSQYSGGPSKRVHAADAFETQRSLNRMYSDGAGPSQPFGFDMGRDDLFDLATRGSTHASSVVAMDTVHSADDDSMESVENYPGYMDDVHFPSTSSFRNTDQYETSEVNYSSQAQQSACPAVAQNAGDMGGVSSTNDEEVVNVDTTTTAPGRDVISFGISGGSVGMGASHEAEIHGADASVHRADSVEAIAEITENQGQTGEFASDPGLMGDYVPEGMDPDPEDPHGDSQDIMSHTVGKADSGSKVVGSVESGEKNSNIQEAPAVITLHPSLSCDAVVCSGYEVSKEEVTQTMKPLPTSETGYVESGYLDVTDTGPPNGESNYEEAVEFDPIKHHNYFCPWVNGNVAAAGSSSGSSSSSSTGGLALCGWQLTLDALDAFQTLGHVPVQPVESESAASLYKDDHPTNRKLLAHHSFSKSCGQN